MTKRYKIILVATLLIIGSAAAGTVYVSNLLSRPANGAETSIPATPQTFAWIPYWDQEAAVASFKANPERFDYIGVFWHALLRDGSIGPYPYAKIDPSLITYAHQRGVKVIGIVANLPTENEGGDWDPDRVDKVIHQTSVRKKHIADIVALVRQYNFDGIHIDYEALPALQRNNFTRFIRELSVALHKEGKTVSVALHPKSEEGNPRFENGSQAQDWKKLSRYADRMHLMLFGEHWETSDPGAAASPTWARPIVQYAQRLIGPHKLYVNIPLYGFDWSDQEESAEGLTFAEVQALIKQHKPEVKWDETQKSHYFRYVNDGEAHEVWFEDGDSVRAKLTLYKSMGVTNFSFWRLGGEHPQVWEIFKDK